LDISEEVNDLGSLGDLAVKFSDDKVAQKQAEQITSTQKTQATPTSSTSNGGVIAGVDKQTLIGAGAVAVGSVIAYNYLT